MTAASLNPTNEGLTLASRVSTDLFTFSDVYFSKNGRLALTAMSSWCGGICGQHQWKVPEKLPTGEWQELPAWVACSTIAENWNGSRT
jgi:hypothetical protein